MDQEHGPRRFRATPVTARWPGLARAPLRRGVRKRCGWAESSAEMGAYHDLEWGVPVHEDRRHFEFLILEGAQAGLSWATILNKRQGYRRAFAGFDPERVARFTARDVRRLVGDAGIVRNRLKIESAVSNARAFLALQGERGSFDAYLWSFVDGRTVVNRRRSMSEIPPRTALSDRVSRDLAGRGFRFVGSTIVYSHLQAVGVVNDHLVTCFRHGEVAQSKPPAGGRHGRPRGALKSPPHAPQRLT